MTDPNTQRGGRITQDCVSWSPNGNSLIAQHPRQHRDPSKYEFVAYTLTYSDFFIYASSKVQFKFRAGQKQNRQGVNGIFRFKIDGVPQDIETGVYLSDQWLTYNFTIGVGSHKLEWIYKKLNQYGVSDDLSAEIEYILIQGNKAINKECQVCDRGLPDEEQSWCFGC